MKNNLNLRRVLSMLLALTLSALAACPQAFAAGTQPENITGVIVNINTEVIVGLTPDDYEQFLSVTTPGLEIVPGNFKAFTNSGIIGDDVDVYYFARGQFSTFRLSPVDGYTLPADKNDLTQGVRVTGRKNSYGITINSSLPTYTISSADGVHGDYIEITVMYAASCPIKIAGDSVDFRFDTAIEGKSPSDYKEFISVNTEGFEIRQEKFTAQTTYSAGFPDTDVKVYELGKCYSSTVYVYPKDGYALLFNNDCKYNITFNGNKYINENAQIEAGYTFSTDNELHCNYLTINFC